MLSAQSTPNCQYAGDFGSKFCGEPDDSWMRTQQHSSNYSTICAEKHTLSKGLNEFYGENRNIIKER